MLSGWAGWVCSLRGSFERIVGDTFVDPSAGYSRPSTRTVDGAVLAYDRNARATRARISATTATATAFVCACLCARHKGRHVRAISVCMSSKNAAGEQVPSPLHARRLASDSDSHRPRPAHRGASSPRNVPSSRRTTTTTTRP